MKFPFSAAVFLAIAGCAAGNPPARAATWTGAGTDAKWETATNWAENVAPPSGAALLFSSTTNSTSRNGTPNLMLSGITFSADAGICQVTGKPIKLKGDIVNQGANAQSLNVYITLMKNVEITTTGNISLGGVIRGEHYGIDKSGPGQLILTNANDFKGPITVHAGTLVLGNDKVLGASSTIVLTGGNLALDGSASPSVGPLQVVSNAILDFGTGSHTVAFANSKTLSWTGTLSIYNWDGDSTVSNSLSFGTDKTGLTDAQLKAITFYRDNGKLSLGNAVWATDKGQVTYSGTPAK